MIEREIMRGGRFVFCCGVDGLDEACCPSIRICCVRPNLGSILSTGKPKIAIWFLGLAWSLIGGRVVGEVSMLCVSMFCI